MVCGRISLFLSLLSFAILLSPCQVQSNGDEEDLLQGINKYRESLKISKLTKNSKASCLADEIADDLKYHAWNGTDEFTSCDPTGSVARLVNFPKRLRKCDVKPNATAGGVVLPLYMSKFNASLLLINYTRSPYTKFLNSSNFSAVGAGIKDKWTVLILTTHDPAGSFSAAMASAAATKGMLILVLGFFVTLLL